MLVHAKYYAFVTAVSLPSRSRCKASPCRVDTRRELTMRICQLLSIGLALTVSGCASWHQPHLVYRGRPQSAAKRTARLEKPSQSYSASSVGLEFDETIDSDVLSEEETLTPVIEGTPHRSKYRPARTRAQIEAERRARDRNSENSPGPGYVELPAPPDEE